jgi:hypothetical protein
MKLRDSGAFHHQGFRGALTFFQCSAPSADLGALEEEGTVVQFN